VLKGHTSWVFALTVLPDGRLASGSWDMRLWS
jgi:WD40 repeat protein